MILGAVLAGGASRRFGSDKAAALWKGKALIDHVVAGLAPYVTTIVVCGREIADRPVPGLGPLGGLNAALHHARSLGYARVIAVPCDAPLLASSLLTALAAVEGDAILEGMPVIGSWRSCHADALDHHLATATSRSMRGWAGAIGAVSLDLPPPPNVNRLEDLERLGG